MLAVGGDGQPLQAAAARVWNAQHAPVANTKATCTQAAAAGLRNVCRGITVMLVAGASAPTAASVTVALIDGASGVTSYLWGPHAMGIPAVAGATNGVSRPGRWVGSVNTPMTLEFSAAGGANTIESVSMEGETIGA